MEQEPVCVVHLNGHQEWHVDGRLHRLDGPARIWPDGSQEWWVDGQLHRLDGPAVIRADGYRAWYVDAHLHRLDGPALIWADGDQEWYIRDVDVTQEVTVWMQQRDITWPWDHETHVAFLLSFVLT